MKTSSHYRILSLVFLADAVGLQALGTEWSYVPLVLGFICAAAMFYVRKLERDLKERA